jgi:hypothetical protein
MGDDLVPTLVTLHVWGVPARAVPSAVTAMARDRRALARSADLTFAKLLGTGRGRSFTVRDSDPRHWAVLACWGDPRGLDAFERSELARRWARRADPGSGGELLRVLMRPLSSRGRWAGHAPFGAPSPRPHDGPVAAVTRARLRPAKAVTFWRAVPPVGARLAGSPGLQLALGIGEAPVGVQGTFSLWDDAQSLQAFAYGSDEHADAIRRTESVGWYGEELFARLAVVHASGSVAGRTVDVVT